MGVKLLNLMCLVAAVIASGWVLFDLYSVIVQDGVKGSAESEGIFESLLNIPILAAFLFLLITLNRYPARTRNRKTKKKSSRGKSSRGKVVKDTRPGRNNRLSVDSTLQFRDSTTLDVNDYFANPPEDAGQRMYDREGNPLDNSGESSFDSLEPLVEAEVLAKFDRYDQAIEILHNAFSSNKGDRDEIATQMLTIITDELDMESTSLESASLLELKLNEIVAMLSKERAKLSEETWQKIQLEYATQTNNEKGGDSEEFRVTP